MTEQYEAVTEGEWKTLATTEITHLTDEEKDYLPRAWDEWIARVKRDAAREALGSLQSFARECMFNEDLAAEDLAGWHHTWAAALSHRANHYPHPDDEETPMEHNDTRCDSPETLCDDCLHYGAQDGE